MKIKRLQQIKKFYFTKDEIAEVFGVSSASAKVICSRYAKAGLLVRFSRDIYVLEERFRQLSESERFLLANRLQVPSYISFTTALAYYGLTTQVQQDYLESGAQIRTKKVVCGMLTFHYVKLALNYYFGFKKLNNFFIAEPEKALLDAVYLMSLGRYSLDIPALDLSKFDKKIIDRWVKKYPAKTKKLWESIHA